MIMLERSVPLILGIRGLRAFTKVRRNRLNNNPVTSVVKHDAKVISYTVAALQRLPRL